MTKKVREGTALPQWLRKEANALLRSLTTREEKVLRLRFGMLTPAEKGRLRALTRAREEAKRQFDEAMRKRMVALRHPGRSKKLKDFLGED